MSQSAAALLSLSRPRTEDVTTLTRDLALLLRAGARIDDALELLASDIDIGRLRPVVAQIKASVLAGESFAEAIARHPSLFPAMYVALVRVGEASGMLRPFVLVGLLLHEHAYVQAGQAVPLA